MFDFPYTPAKEISPEITTPGVKISEKPSELSVSKAFSCPVEIPLGELTDKLRESAVSLIVKLEMVADMENEMASKIIKMENLISQCTSQNCKSNCRCIPNPVCPIPVSYTHLRAHET